ncbi:hypothetical protein HPP92_021330 [Vanilla planifolia]|uniref:Uncharacterized protein n=1 Tax=Vanilla planifolia TaxID=51239 RepID=A0A835UH04_VANPL|nr:hypothetical protein HPP92_021330 [Vanilla planifolia]
MSTAQLTLVVYPNTTSTRPSSSSENGSFGPLIAVVSVILVLTIHSLHHWPFLCSKVPFDRGLGGDHAAFYSKEDVEAYRRVALRWLWEPEGSWEHDAG